MNHQQYTNRLAEKMLKHISNANSIHLTLPNNKIKCIELTGTLHDKCLSFNTALNEIQNINNEYIEILYIFEDSSKKQKTTYIWLFETSSLMCNISKQR